MALDFDPIHKADKSRFLHRQERSRANPAALHQPSAYFYFYKSLRIVLIIWIIIVFTVSVYPWLDYWVKTKIEKTVASQYSQIMGTSILKNQGNEFNIDSSSASLTGKFLLAKEGLNIDAPIVEGIDESNLAKGIGHHPNSVWPNQRGNVILAGHNFDLDTENPYGQVFLNLRSVEINDKVTILYRGAKYNYTIFRKETVSADDQTYFQDTDDWRLTFYTCDPPHTDWRRLVLQAKLDTVE